VCALCGSTDDRVKNPFTGLMSTLTRDSEVVEQEIADSPTRYCQMTVVFLAGLGALQGGDRLEVADVVKA
jgi:hypothetical protein